MSDKQEADPRCIEKRARDTVDRSSCLPERSPGVRNMRKASKITFYYFLRVQNIFQAREIIFRIFNIEKQIFGKSKTEKTR